MLWTWIKDREVATDCWAWVVCGALLVACGGDDTGPGAGGGGGTGGNTGSGGSPVGSGGVATGTGGTATSSGGGGTAIGTGGAATGSGGEATGSGGATTDDAGISPPPPCLPIAAPNERVTTFTADADFNATNRTWGTSMSLTGGTFTYQGTTPSTPTLTYDMTAQNLVVTATVAAGDYAGFGFYFGPGCVDESAYAGVSFTMSGSTAGAQAVCQIQTDPDYPIDTTNNKGHCAGTFASGCASPSRNFAVQTTPTPITIAFADLAGGVPSVIDPMKLLGIQWQFNCPAAADGGVCAMSVTLDNVFFIADLDAASPTPDTGTPDGASPDGPLPDGPSMDGPSTDGPLPEDGASPDVSLPGLEASAG